MGRNANKTADVLWAAHEQHKAAASNKGGSTKEKTATTAQAVEAAKADE